MNPIVPPEPREPFPAGLSTHDVIRHLTHELRQPLSALESLAFHLQMTVGDGSPAIYAQVQRMQQMVDNANWVLSDMLHLLQMAPAVPVNLDAAELGAEVMAESWVSEGLEIRHNFDEAMPAVLADREQVRHLLQGIMQFLWRTVPEPRSIEVQGATSGDELRLEFRAFAPTVMADSLFLPLEPYQLLTCSHIAARNGGRFLVEKDEQGWLRLTVTLPLADADGETPAEE